MAAELISSRLSSTSVASARHHASWQGAIAEPGREFPLTPLTLLCGQIPAGLRGRLYRNGAARLERNGQRVGHWFDGDGAVLAVRFTDAGATATYRYVQTDAFIREAQADRFLHANYGGYSSGSYWQRWQMPIKNAANTHVIPTTDRLLALWEGGAPHALDPDTLETLGRDDLGTGDPNLTCSAHPKRDPVTGDIYNFGISVNSGRPQLTLYHLSPQGQVQQQRRYPLDGMTIIHDFVLAGPYLVVMIAPVRLQLLPFLLKLKTVSAALQWRPQLGMQIMVFDRENLNLINRSTTDPWFFWHVGNGAVDADGNIVCDLAKLPDWTTNQRLQEVASGKLETAAPARLSRLVIAPQSATIKRLDSLCDLPCEFPTIDPRRAGQPWRYTYLAVYHTQTSHSSTDSIKMASPITGSEDSGPERTSDSALDNSALDNTVTFEDDWLNDLARYDHHTGELMQAQLAPGFYPSEPLYAADKYDPRQGWILSVIYNGVQHQSEVWVFKSDRLNDEPVCRLALPSVIPHSFHGSWQPQ